MRKISITLLLLIFQLNALEANASWLDSFYSTAVATSPNAAKNQKRSYYSAGGFSARVEHTSDPLMNVSLPSINAGCGGIDVFFGGVSFLNPSYLIEKATGMLKNAPYVIFQLGLKALSTQFADTIDAAQAITDQLNQLQLDECAATKGVISMAMGEGAGSLTGEFDRLASNTNKLVTGIEKDFTKALTHTNEDPGKAKKDALDSKKDMDAKLKHLATEKGLILETIVKWEFMNKSQADAVRALVGDIAYDGTEDSQVEQISGCAYSMSFKNYVEEQTPLQKSRATTCAFEKQSILDRSRTSLDAMHAYLTKDPIRKGEINADVANFVDLNYLPILSYLEDISTDAAFAEGELGYLSIASAAGFAYYSVLNLSHITNKMIIAIEDAATAEGDYLIQIKGALGEYRKRINAKLVEFREGYTQSLYELKTQFEIIDQMKKNVISNRVKNSFEGRK